MRGYSIEFYGLNIRTWLSLNNFENRVYRISYIWHCLDFYRSIGGGRGHVIGGHFDDESFCSHLLRLPGVVSKVFCAMTDLDNFLQSSMIRKTWCFNWSKRSSSGNWLLACCKRTTRKNTVRCSFCVKPWPILICVRHFPIEKWHVVPRSHSWRTNQTFHKPVIA